MGHVYNFILDKYTYFRMTKKQGKKKIRRKKNIDFAIT